MQRVLTESKLIEARNTWALGFWFELQHGAVRCFSRIDCSPCQHFCPESELASFWANVCQRHRVSSSSSCLVIGYAEFCCGYLGRRLSVTSHRLNSLLVRTNVHVVDQALGANTMHLLKNILPGSGCHEAVVIVECRWHLVQTGKSIICVRKIAARLGREKYTTVPWSIQRLEHVQILRSFSGVCPDPWMRSAELWCTCGCYCSSALSWLIAGVSFPQEGPQTHCETITNLRRTQPELSIATDESAFRKSA